MTSTIGNPLSWGARLIGRAGGTVGTATAGVAGSDRREPVIRDIGVEDIRAALKAGVEDFMALRTDVAVICLLYPIIGAILVYLAVHQNLLPLVFPLASGFALVGPAAAVGLYEMSKRRERGEPAGWADGFAVLGMPSVWGILALGVMLVGTFVIWMFTAYVIYLATMGPDLPATASAFLRDLFTTDGGWALIIVGTSVGFAFAAVVLAVSAFSFPLMIDRDIGLPRAVATSVRVARRNPRTVALWGMIVATLLVVGSIPVLLGLAVVLPVLGHATWHLYRRAIG
jgi:uncharacterized membrane protein